MTGEVNRVPLGLLSLLDMKARGQNPRMLSNEVSGSIELLPLYEIQRIVSTTANTSVSMSTPGYYSTSALNVPENNIWHVYQISIQFTVAAATTYVIAPACRRRSQGAVLDFALAPAQTYTATQVVSAGWQGDLWLGPGDAPSVACPSVTLGTASAAAIRVAYVPYEI